MKDLQLNQHLYKILKFKNFFFQFLNLPFFGDADFIIEQIKETKKTKKDIINWERKINQQTAVWYINLFPEYSSTFFLFVSINLFSCLNDLIVDNPEIVSVLKNEKKKIFFNLKFLNFKLKNYFNH
jgi:hypothetical protein